MTPSQFDVWLQLQSQPSLSDVFKKPLIMGVLNRTSDSFSDGGAFLSLEHAGEHALHLISCGADIIDIGGESTRPGASHVPLELELERVLPLIEYIRTYSDVCISIDTYKPEVMEAAVHAGANIINDVYALRQKGALAMAAQLAVPVCLMHMQGQPGTMQNNPQYPEGILHELLNFFTDRIEACKNAGINTNQLLLDPGFGFGKNVADNLKVLACVKRFKDFNQPLLLGVSRKSTIGALLHKEVGERLIGGIAIAVYAALHGIALLRTHDVDETNQALHIIDAIYQSQLQCNFDRGT